MFGVPWLTWAGAAAVLTLVFSAGLGAPSQRNPGWRGVFLRWGHAGVWLALTILFLALSFGPAAEALAGPLGLIALLTYVAFLGVLLTSRHG
jgi:hypothetical protein